MNTFVALGHILTLLLQLFAALLVADLFSGVLHWVEDRYLKRHWPVVGRLIVEANDVHHACPRAFTKDGFWLRNWPSLFVAAVLALGFCAVGCITVFTVSLVLVSSVLPTQAHYWAHRTVEENPRIVTALQRAGLFQSAQHHWRHHRGAKDKYFCTMTNFVNPVLERFQIFHRLERLMSTMASMQAKIVS
ncbi:MAG: fatty acid desaturase CarF family protein [Pseudomonadota bacterium]